MDLLIDEQFKTIIPPLTQDEFAKLTENVLAEGVRDRLVIWGNTLIDGHNRYKIATENNLSFETVERTFESREHVLNWIISNQMGRRNLSDAQISYLRGKRYENEKKMNGGQGGNRFAKVQLNHNDEPVQNGTTSQRIAGEYGVGTATIQRDEQFAKGIDLLPPTLKSDVLSGETQVTKNDIMALAKMDDGQQKKAVDQMYKGDSIPDAIKKSDPNAARKERDVQLRAEMKRDREKDDRVKFSPNIMKFRDVTVCSVDEIRDNGAELKGKTEVWIFNSPEKAHLAKIELRKIFNLKIN